MGPLVTASTSSAVRGYVDLGVQEGAALVVDGRRAARQGQRAGYFLGPACSTTCSRMRIYREDLRTGVSWCGCQTSSPRFHSSCPRVRNGTGDLHREREAAGRSRSAAVGMVGVNVLIVPRPFHSFGGWKRSAVRGRCTCMTGRRAFLHALKTVTSRWPTSARGARSSSSDDEVVGAGGLPRLL